ncbi:MAG: putative lipoprotein [Rhizobium sp.]|nr:putative lipoprotein [Rhizobium sp.]
MGDGLGMPGFNTTDKKLTTSAVQTSYQAQPDSVSDESTVRNAVSSADISSPGAVSIPWANTSTGSAGVITTITEENNGSYTCRVFKTTRHSYRGISNFDGKACLVGSGEWQMINFKEVG